MYCVQQHTNKLIKITNTTDRERERIEGDIPCLVVDDQIFIPMDCQDSLDKIFPNIDYKHS